MYFKPEILYKCYNESIFRQDTEVDEFKALFSKVDDMDNFEVRTQLNRLLVGEVPGDNFIQMRLKLKRVLLEEILKVETENRIYLNYLSEINKALPQKPKGYSCCLTGCRFEGRDHKAYVRHIKLTHPRVTNISCKFRHCCSRNFASIENLIQHIKEEHSAISTVVTSSTSQSALVIDVPCKCNLVSCGSTPKQFSNLKDLLKHFNTDHFKDARVCVFENCNKQFNAFSVSRHHFRLKHMKTGDAKLKACHLLGAPILQPSIVLNPNLNPQGQGEGSASDTPGHNTEEYTIFDIDNIENAEIYGGDDDEDEDFFLQYYADFLNRLVHFKFLPQSTIQDIAEEYYKSSKKSQDIRERKLRDSLESVTELNEDQINKIVDNVIKDDFFLKAQGELNSQYKRTKFVQQNMQYVAPVEILLNQSEVEKGQKKDVIHYIPMDSALKTLLEDPSLLKLLEREKNKPKINSSKINDIQDGSLIKSNPFFQENPEALGLLLYSDALELKNPLGAARGTYKVVQIFYTIINIPKNQRSQVDKLQLAMIFREKLFKKYSSQVIYKRIVEDLIKLESGIVMNIPEPKLTKVGLLLHAADNLEAHTIGGFSASFSSKSVCRICHIQYSELEDNIHDHDGDKAHDRWTVQEYDEVAISFNQRTEVAGSESQSEYVVILDENNDDLILSSDDGSDDDDEESDEESDATDDDIEDDDNEGSPEDSSVEIINKWGLKSMCPLNVLQSFHCVRSFPPDLLHDWMEGVLAEDLLSIIRTLSSKGWFSIESYNSALSKFGWTSYETGDKPQSVHTSRKATKLKGKAISQWVHIRNFPLIVRKFIKDKKDSVLGMALKLHEITERITAAEYYQYEIEILNEAVIDYLDMRKTLRFEFPEFFKRPKPKHHYIRE